MGKFQNKSTGFTNKFVSLKSIRSVEYYSILFSQNVSMLIIFLKKIKRENNLHGYVCYSVTTQCTTPERQGIKTAYVGRYGSILI